MTNSELYLKVLDAYKSNDENYFTAAAINWVQNAESAPFEDSSVRELFSKAKANCKTWRSQAINRRVSKIRMIQNIRDIAKMNLPDPYLKDKETTDEPVVTWVTEDPDLEQIKYLAEKTLPKPTEEQIEEIIKKTPQHILGVLPEETIKELNNKLKPKNNKKHKRFFGERQSDR